MWVQSDVAWIMYFQLKWFLRVLLLASHPNCLALFLINVLFRSQSRGIANTYLWVEHKPYGFDINNYVINNPKRKSINFPWSQWPWFVRLALESRLNISISVSMNFGMKSWRCSTDRRFVKLVKALIYYSANNNRENAPIFVVFVQVSSGNMI